MTIPTIHLKPMAIVLFAASLLLAGCGETAYYWQAGMGQMEILRKRRPIEEVLADSVESEVVKTKLRLVLQVREYGGKLMAMPQDGSYRYYADLKRDYVSWLVVASQRFAVKEVTQCYLVVGCLGYRGYFDPEDAKAFAADLTQEGYDVTVRPVRAYSTLGWFDDPVLNTYIRSSDLNLISTILHEQAHQVLFIKGDTAFNESFATFVEEEGVHQFLKQKGSKGDALIEHYKKADADQALFQQIVLNGRKQLETLYKKTLPPVEMERAKAETFEAMRNEYRKQKKSFEVLNYDHWFNRDLNNAHLVGVQQYYSWVGAFRQLFRQEDSDFPRFFAAVRLLSELPEEQRTARLKALEEKTLARN